MKVCQEYSSSFQCFLDSINPYIPGSVSSLLLNMDMSGNVLLVLTLDILIFHDVYFTALSEGVRHRWTDVGTQENGNGKVLLLMSSWDWKHWSWRSQDFILLRNPKILNRIISESSTGLSQFSFLFSFQ